MQAKKSNVIYMLFMVITIPVFLAFIFVPLITARQQGYSINYNTTTSVGDYIVKITNAAYITDTEEFIFIYNHKLAENKSLTKQSLSISYLYFQYTADDDYADKTKELQDDKLNDITDKITAPEIKDDIKYVTIFTMIDVPAYQDADTVDEFGNPIQGKYHEREYKEVKFRIGKEDIRSMTKSEYEDTLKSIESVNSEAEIDTAVTDENGKGSITKSSTTTAQDRVPAPMPTKTKKADSSSEIDSSDSSKASSTTKRTNEKASDEHRADNNENNGQDYNDNNDYYDNQNNNERQPNDYQATEAPQTTTQAATQRPVYTTTTTQKSVVYITGIRLDTGFTGNNILLTVGNSHGISAVITPDNADNKKVYWSTNRSDIAVVDGSGTITAVGAGKAIITATTEDGGLTASCMVTVS